jgi:predicted transport protein
MEVNETKIDKEKTLQEITEKNLGLIFGLEFVCSEFPVGEYRLDTLAFAPETKSFVIIEYKKRETRSVIDQGYAYLGKMLDGQAEFVLQYNNLNRKNLDVKDIDWAQSRIYFVSTAFNTYQIGSLIFNDLPISLWEVKTYKDGHISYRRLDQGGSSASIKKLASPNTNIGKISKKVIVYTEESHLKKGSDETRALYETLRDNILQRWSLNVDPKKLYIAFKSKTNVVDVEIQKSKLKLTLNVPQGKLLDSLNLAEDVSLIGRWGNGDYQIIMRNDEHLSHILSLIEQSVKMHQ